MNIGQGPFIGNVEKQFPDIYPRPGKDAPLSRVEFVFVEIIGREDKKTGTAAKLIGGRYSRSEYNASFVGSV